MKKLNLITLLLALLGLTTAVSAADITTKSPNGISIPENYRDWRLISASHRTDNYMMKVVLGNDIAITAARAGETKPWPEGSILAKLVWKAAVMPSWKGAVVPGDFLMADFMIKDTKKFASTKGWGYARWKGTGLEPYGKDASFAMECSGCHSIESGNDFVFTRPVQLP